MKGTILKIVFKDDMAFLTKEVALDFKQVELPEGSVRFETSAFWTIRVINHNQEEKKLFVEVVDYQVGETEFSTDQLRLNDTLIQIEKVTFKSIDTSGWLNTMNSTGPRKFMPARPETVYRQEPPVRVPVKNIYKEPFSIPIKDISFLSGKVSFEKKIQPLGKLIKFEILNENIIEQFDAIKNYFANVLQTKKIQVVPMVITVDGKIESVNATSSEIDKIDKTLIVEVKFEVVKDAQKQEVPGDKHLFTMEEYLETFISEGIQQLFKDDSDFFETLLEKSETKHHNHLRFLSSRHRHDLQKLRFVHKPFSFVFLLGRMDNFYIIWETLDTEEATYIWTFPNNMNDTNQILAEIDNIINLILRDGKIEYIARREENFTRVLHDYKDPKNGFRAWKQSIEKILI